MELVLKRRIMNAVLTIYLPTALVSSVLHVVCTSVISHDICLSGALHRLRHQLLQGLLLWGGCHGEPDLPPRPNHPLHQVEHSWQLFLIMNMHSVSDSLPKTAYVKLVDIWLIFAQLVPWIEVLHIWISTLGNSDTTPRSCCTQPWTWWGRRRTRRAERRTEKEGRWVWLVFIYRFQIRILIKSVHIPR